MQLHLSLRMIAGMTTEKIAITVPRETLSAARQAVKSGKAASLSAYISSAIEHKAMFDDLDSLLEELLCATGGPLTAAERRKADSILSGASLRTARK